MPEEYECSNCWWIGPLDTHGRCERCGSEAVLSQEVTGKVEAA